MASDNVISIDNGAGTPRRRLSDATLRRLESASRAIVSKTLQRLVQDLFENLDDDLYELAGKSGSDTLQTRYFDAMRDLRLLRSDIEKGFMAPVMEDFDNFWRFVPTENPIKDLEEHDGDLSLVDDEELEENLAVAGLVSKAENRFHRSLHALSIRVGHVLGKGEISNEDLPFGPSAVAGHFRRALAKWEGDIPVKLFVYKIFDRHVMGYVGGMYDELNDVFVAADVLPTIARRIKRNPVAPSVLSSRGEAAHAGESAADEAKATGDDVLDSAKLADILGSLLHRRRATDPQTAARLLQLPAVASQQVVDALQNLQQETLDTTPVDVAEARAGQQQLLAKLATSLQMGEGKAQRRRYEEFDQNMIDVISMLFDFIFDNSGLPDAMKALLARLQIPMLRVSLTDKTFLSNREHPARRLLNSLAHAVVGWVDDGDRSAESLYGQVESVVTQVLTRYDGDMSLFDGLNDAFNSYIEREARGADVAEQRLAQVTRGQEQLRLARQEVHKALYTRMSAMEAVPEIVKQILDGPWRDVLLLAYLREGGESEAWENAVKVVDRLLWSVSPGTAKSQRPALIKAIPDLLKSLRSGMANISYDQYKAASLFNALQVCHIACLRGQPVGPLETVPEDVVEEVQQAPEMTQDTCTELVSALVVGQWMEWQSDNDEVVRGKLSWKSDVTDTYLFVSRRGVKVAEMKKHEVAELFRNRHACLLEDVDKPLMDRALKSMVSALKNTTAGPSPEPAPA